MSVLNFRSVSCFISNFFWCRYHSISFIKLSQNREQGEIFTSHLSLNNWQPSHLSGLPLRHMPETEIRIHRTCYTMVHHNNHKDWPKNFFGANHHNIQKGAWQFLKHDVGNGKTLMITTTTTNIIFFFGANHHNIRKGAWQFLKHDVGNGKTSMITTTTTNIIFTGGGESSCRDCLQ